METIIKTEPIPWVIRYPQQKYRKKERIGTEKFYLKFVYGFLDIPENRELWVDEIDFPLNCLSLDELILDANLEYNKPSIYNVFCLMKYLETINLDEAKPILLDWKNKIVDGRHRILKALVEGKSTIKVWKIKVGLDMDKSFLQYMIETPY